MLTLSQGWQMLVAVDSGVFVQSNWMIILKAVIQGTEGSGRIAPFLKERGANLMILRGGQSTSEIPARFST
jgi:hypothetical protein